MREVIRLYGGLLPVSWRDGVAYRGRVWLDIFRMFFPLLMMWVWLTIAQQQGGSVNGLDSNFFVRYYVTAAVVAQVSVTSISMVWDDAIRLGTLSSMLLRPADPVHHLLCKELCRRALAASAGIPMLIIVLIVTGAYPGNPLKFLLGIAALLIGFMLNFFMATAIGMLAFWLTQVQRITLLWTGIGSFLAGGVAPLRLLPHWFQDLAAVLPFKATLGTPVELLTGDAAVLAGLRGLGAGLVWTAVALLIYRVLWRRGLRQYSAVGA
ncbi:ABC transporter permease [Streptomyces sp. NPDC056909]|uniref:ABC transporter permease n=1 Tax=Streptomyces sp. NPDC056909 TaxID=3345963 RepID=UPI00367A2707